MNVKQWDAVRTLADKRGIAGNSIPRGTLGVVVEVLGRPPAEGYLVDVALTDPMLVGGQRYDSVILHPHEFEAGEDVEEEWVRTHPPPSNSAL